MPFEPRAGDSGEREREEKQVERRLHGLRRDAHPARNRRRVRPRVDHPPQYAHRDEREHALSQRLVQLSVEIPGVRVHALFGSSGALATHRQTLSSMPTNGGASKNRMNLNLG